jgi:hypothetical protein
VVQLIEALCATSRKVACLIPDGDVGIFHSHNPFGRNMVLGSAGQTNKNEYQQYAHEDKGCQCEG